MQACVPPPRISEIEDPARITPETLSHRDLVNLPEPNGKIVVSVYSFRDQTGQYKFHPTASSFSTAVTQGSTSMLIKALKESNWFVPVEREGLQDLLTERKIIRAALKSQAKENDKALEPPPLIFSRVLLEGGIIGYESNTMTGGAGARYFGAGASSEYRVDQITVYLRAVDINTGRILNSVSTTKSIYSQEMRAGLYRFVRFKRLLELEAGFTTNEPAQLCVLEAIEKSVVGLIVEGVADGTWALKNPEDFKSPVIEGYLNEKKNVFSPQELERLAEQG